MEKYIKKHKEEVLAIKFTRNNWKDVVAFTDGDAHSIVTEKRIDGKCTCLISSGNGNLVAKENDYITKDYLGQYDVFSPSDFDNAFVKVGNTFKDIFIKHGQEMQRREGVEVSSTEELMAEISVDPEFVVLENMAKEYATIVAKDALSRAANQFTSGAADTILKTEIVTP